MVKEHAVGGGLSIISALGAIAAVAQLGFPFPPGAEDVFTYVLAPAAALVGYYTGAAIEARAQGWALYGAIFLCAAVFAGVGYFYFVQVHAEISPGPLYVFFAEGLPFSISIAALYALGSLIGFSLFEKA